MIDTDLLKIILRKYGIDPDKVIKNNSNVLEKGNYIDIENTIKYLVEELKVSPKNIEKAPSILYFNVSAIKKNIEFLKTTEVTFSNVESCLHVLSTIPWRLEETYNYIKDNYGISSINRTTSILKIDVDRIKEIERLGLSKELVLSASISRLSVEDIRKDILVCRENDIEITGSVFYRSADEIKEIVTVCRENGLEITGSVFFKSADDIKEIVAVCRENGIEITGSVFLKSAEEIKKIVTVCRENGIEITGSVFSKSADEIRKIVQVCRENGIEITGSVFLKSAKQLQENIDFLKENYDESYLSSLIVSKSAKQLREVFPYLDSLGVLENVKESASILTLTVDEIKTRKAFIESIGEDIVLDNGKFNSIFGLSKKNYAKKVEAVHNVNNK